MEFLKRSTSNRSALTSTLLLVGSAIVCMKLTAAQRSDLQHVWVVDPIIYCFALPKGYYYTSL